MDKQIKALNLQLENANAKIAELQESSNNFYRVFYNAVDAILIISGDKFVDCNDATLTMLNANNKDEVMNTHPSQLSPEHQPDGRSSYDKANKMIAIAFKKGFNRFEWTHKKLSGEEFPVEVSLTVIEFKGEFVLHTSWRDITDRKQHQMHLALKNRELIFKQSALDEHAIVSTTDIEGNIISANDKFCSINGYTQEELIGQNHRILKSEEHSREFFVNLWGTVTQGLPWHGEIKDAKKNGETYWSKTTIVPFLDDDGKPFQYMAVRTDITDRKTAEFRALHAKTEADKANQAKSDFLSAMSHELRTPLNAILGFGQLLELNSDHSLSDNEKDYISQILSGGKHLLGLIDDILDLAHIESGKMELVIDNVCAMNIVSECRSLMSVIAKEYGIEIIVLGEVNKTLQVRSDRARFKQVTTNLLSNAIKYNRKNGKVTVRYKKTPANMLRIEVTDTGYGIPENKLSELFKPFNRLGAEQTDIEGTGIGLVVCKDLIELMNGTIGVVSNVGEGSTFWFEVPMSDLSDNTPITTGITQVAAKKTFSAINGTLLYVEDNPANIKLIESLVSKIEGLTLVCANTGESGIELALTTKPDVIILDINLPGMNGIDVLKELRRHKETRNTPVIAMSAAATKRDIDLGREAGFLNYLTKPVQIIEVVDAIKSALKDE